MSDSPPKPRLSLSVGVVGHRPNRLPKAALARVTEETAGALAQIAEKVQTVLDRHGSVFTEEPPVLTLISALAEGADRIAAEAALARGYSLTAVLPFDSDDYMRDFDGEASKTEYTKLLDTATTRLVFPGARATEDLAYRTAGLTIVDNADILLVVWDGGKSRGWGGTTDLIEHAAQRDVPIVYVDAKGEQDTSVLWSGLAGFTASSTSVLELPSSDLSNLSRVVDDLTNPPSDKEESEKLSRYLREPWKSWNLRLGYPFLLASLLVRVMRKNDIRPPTPATLATDFEAQFNSEVDAPCAQEAAVARVASAYGWADALGVRYGQVFRGAYTENFVFAALAVLAGVAAIFVSEFLEGESWPLALVEIVLLAFVFGNTRFGQKRDWHTRWRESREVAERLRAAETLWNVALPSLAFHSNEATWTGWYSRAQMRGLGLTGGTFNADRLEETKQKLIGVVESQCAYHTRSAGLMRRVDQRIETLGSLLFGLAALCAIMSFAISFFAIDLQHHWNLLLLGLTAALPALGAATFGIRLIGDFEGVADRDERTAASLSGILDALKHDQLTLASLRSRTRSVADVMLGDLSHWRTTTETRKLVEPA